MPIVVLNSCRRYSGLLLQIALVLFFCTLAQAAKPFEQCLADLKQKGGDIVGGTDNQGSPVPITEATGMTYRRCIDSCGSGQEPFDWGVFTQQFSAWLLPWLALVSQLPFGAILPKDNLVSVLLAMGSPTLAAYSLAITALNGQWVKLRFSRYTHFPNVGKVVRILNGLQQAPLRVTNEHGVLSCLVVLRENDIWFAELAQWIRFQHTWSVSAATSVGWVLVAYFLTVAESLTNVTKSAHSSGQAVGSILLWLLAVVVGWLRMAPKIEATRLNNAMEKANKLAKVATASGAIVPAESISLTTRAFTLASYECDSVTTDELATAPIFNYARFLPWVQAVEDVAFTYQHASDKLSRNLPVASQSSHLADLGAPTQPATLAQIQAYCNPESNDSDSSDEYPPKRPRQPSTWGPGVLERFLAASAVALFLQWSTTGSAVIIHWFTPTKGLACRSGSYMSYGALSTVIWVMIVSSSFLSHAARLRYSHYRQSSASAETHSPPLSARILKLTADALRRSGKTLAALNAVGLIVICVFQFANFFDTCFCNSSKIYWKERAFAIVFIDPSTESEMRGAWIGGLILALAGVFFFIGFIMINLYTSSALTDLPE